MTGTLNPERSGRYSAVVVTSSCACSATRMLALLLLLLAFSPSHLQPADAATRSQVRGLAARLKRSSNSTHRSLLGAKQLAQPDYKLYMHK